MKPINRVAFFAGRPSSDHGTVPGHVEVYATGSRFAWRRVAANGQVVSTDHRQGYVDKGECVEMALRLNPGVEAYDLT